MPSLKEARRLSLTFIFLLPTSMANLSNLAAHMLTKRARPCLALAWSAEKEPLPRTYRKWSAGIVEITTGTCYPFNVLGKIRPLDDLKVIVAKAKSEGRKVVFTNGCFDLLHRGHLHLLRGAKKLGDLLIVAINSDSSVRKIKGPRRPILQETERAELIAALEMVDYVTTFDDPDPYTVVKELKPNVLVKGGDWDINNIIGKEIVEEYGGKITVIPYLEGHSTTQIIERMRKS